MNDVVATSWRQLVHQALQLATTTSRAYRLGLLIGLLLYISAYLLTFLLMLKPLSLQGWLQILLRSAVDAMLFIGLSHLLVRPYLKLILLPAGGYGSNLFGYLLYSLLFGQLAMLITNLASDLLPEGEIDLRKMTMSGEKTSLHLDMTDPILMIVGGFNLTVTCWVWSLAYVVWHNQLAKRRMQREMHQAQLQQLTNQLNPHFLFNALNSIRALIFEDQHKAADAVTRLSELFRVHLQAHLRPLSTLAEEWQLASHYLEIEQIRFEQRLRVETDFADSLWQQKLPTLSLLTLIENAVKHGIAQCPQGGVISITSRVNGAGKTPGWQLQVCNTAPAGGTSQASGTGTGLSNTRHRLQLMAARNQLQFSQQDNLVCVCMELYDELEDADR